MRKNSGGIKSALRSHIHTNLFKDQVLLLADLLEDHGYYLSREKQKLNQFLLFDKFGFSPENKELLPDHDGRIESSDVLHQGIHVLTALNFPGKMRNRPHMVVFNECLGMGLEYLLLSAFIKRYPNRNTCPMAGIELSSARLGRDFRPLLNASLTDPFKMYKKIVFTGEKVCWKFIKESVRISKTKTFKPAPFLASIKRIPEFLFIADVNFVGIANYIRSYCGTQSTKLDMAQRNDCARILSESKSFGDFILNLKDRYDHTN